MILMSLLLVITLERVLVKSSTWHIEFYASQYRQWLIHKNIVNEQMQQPVLWGVMFLPALLLFIAEAVLFNTIITFLVQSIILFVCVGCPALRSTYRCFLNAAERGDLQACTMYTDQLGHCEDKAGTPLSEGRSFGQHLTWLNYQHYAAVILWFIAFGAPGALFYCVSRSTTEYMCCSSHPMTKAAAHLMFALDYIPVRITAFGMLFMGHFSRALPEWLKHGFSTQISAYDFLTSISAKAEMLTPEEQEQQQVNAAVEPKVLVKLAKRNVMFLLASASILTLVGVIA